MFGGSFAVPPNHPPCKMFARKPLIGTEKEPPNVHPQKGSIHSHDDAKRQSTNR